MFTCIYLGPYGEVSPVESIIGTQGYSGMISIELWDSNVDIVCALFHTLSKNLEYGGAGSLWHGCLMIGFVLF